MDAKRPQYEHVDRPLVSVQTLASRLGCSEKHVRRLATSGRMPAPVLVGRLLRWDADAVDSWIVAGCPQVR
jgi:excisionase family DNA binding protein